MSRNATSSIGALHPILFFMVVYGISLFLAIFVCRTVYNSLQDEPSPRITQIEASAGATASR